MFNRLGQVFLVFSILVLIIVVFVLLKPSGNSRYHLIISGISKGRIHPFKAKFRPYKGKKMGGAAGIATVVKETVASFSGEPFNYLSVGSEISGTADAYFTRGLAVVKALNGCNLEGMLVGNIEFTFGQERLKELSAQSEFPFLSSNIHEAGTEHTPSYINPELILTPGRGLKIGIVGITPPNTPDLTSKGNVLGLEFLPPDSSLKKRIANLRQASVDLVVLLTLYDKERISPAEWTAIADAQPDICVMLDYQVDNPPAIMKDGIIIKTVSGYNKSKEIDVLDLELSGKPVKVISFAGRRIPVNLGEVDPDKKVQEIIDNETRQVGAIKEKVIGSFAGDYKRMFSQECPIGNMITDAMRDSTGAEIAIQNSGGIQNNIREGEMTFGDLFDVMPFDNQLVTMNLSGNDLLELFTNSASIRRGILQVSGCSYKFANRGFNDYELKEVLVDGSPVVATQTYSVTTNSFLADGGDNFLAFKRGRNLQYGLQLRDAVQKYIEKQSMNGPIELSISGRVVRSE